MADLPTACRVSTRNQGLSCHHHMRPIYRPRSRRCPPYALPVYPTARRGGLRGAGGISTASRIAANIDRGFCPQNRSAAVVPSVRVRKKLCIAVRQIRFLGWSSPRSGWFLNERYPLRPSTLALERWNYLRERFGLVLELVLLHWAQRPERSIRLTQRGAEALGQRTQ